jgi:hypothetical protein
VDATTVLKDETTKPRHAAALALLLPTVGLAVLAFRYASYPDYAPSFIALLMLALVQNMLVAIPFAISAWLMLRFAADMRRVYSWILLPLTIIAFGRTLDLAVWMIRVKFRH